MLEPDWVNCASTETLLARLPVRLTERLWRLLAVGICRQFAHFEEDAELWASLAQAEAFADGQLTVARLHEQHRKAARIQRELLARAVEASAAWQAERDRAAREPLYTAFVEAGRRAAAARLISCTLDRPITHFFQPPPGNAAQTALLTTFSECLIEEQAAVVHDVVENPFHRATFDADWAAWRDGFIQHLARDIYANHRWEDMPILGDALEDAGCSNPTILQHCHGKSPHVRGCWVVDRLLKRTPGPRAVLTEVLLAEYAERYCTPLESVLAGNSRQNYRVDLLVESVHQPEAVTFVSTVEPGELPAEEEVLYPLAVRTVADSLRARVCTLMPRGRLLGGVRITLLGLRYPAEGDVAAILPEVASDALAFAIREAVMVPLESSSRGPVPSRRTSRG